MRSFFKSGLPYPAHLVAEFSRLKLSAFEQTLIVALILMCLFSTLSAMLGREEKHVVSKGSEPVEKLASGQPHHRVSLK